MPFTVQQLIESQQKLITTTPQETAQQVLETMIEHDFSQLPVVDEDGKPLGIVTSDSILKALSHFGIPLADLQISHAIVKVRPYSPDDDLFDLLNGLKDRYAVLITDSEHKLVGIVTSYDTTEYFRRRAEDTMYVEDIESTIKDFIKIAFNADVDDISQNTLGTAIADVTGTDIRNKLQNALNHYLNLHDKENAKVNQNFVNEVFLKHFVDKKEIKELDDLTLNEYIQLLLHKSKKTSLVSIFSLKAEAINKLLKEVGKTRNDLMHFRGEISAKQRDQLHFCAQWLENQRSKILDAFSSKGGETKAAYSVNTTDDTDVQHTHFTDKETLTDTIRTTQHVQFIDEIESSDSVVHTQAKADVLSPLDELKHPNDSRYAPLALLLQENSSVHDKVQLTFKMIEEIIGDDLPASAYQHPSWWTKENSDNTPSQQWIDVGWTVSLIDIADKIVVFTRIKERKEAYADFFTQLLAELHNLNPFSIRTPSPNGQSWLVIAGVPEGGPIIGLLAFSFARYRKFRVEFYIDKGDKDKNKQIFKALYDRKSIIESELKETLSWEPIEDKRASRIALYHEGTITGSKNDLTKLKKWAISAMLRFQPVMERHVSEVIHDL